MDIDYNELFGLEPDEGGQAQEPADPASLEGGQAQELAEPANQPTEPTQEPAQEPQTEEPSDVDEADGKETPLTPQERKENAARRREAEKQQAIDDAIAKFKAEREAEDQKIFAQLGLKHPETKEPITDRQGVLDQLAKAEEAAMQKRLASGKLTKEDLQNIVMQTPAIRQLQDRAQQAEQSAQAMQAEHFQKTAAAELAAIKQYDPTVESLGDIIAKPGGDKFVGMVQRGLSYLDAYRAVWADEIAANARTAGAAVQRLANGGKEHLLPTQQRGNGGVEVPREVLENYRAMNPGATDAEIRAHYNKTLK